MNKYNDQQIIGKDVGRIFINGGSTIHCGTFNSKIDLSIEVESSPDKIAKQIYDYIATHKWGRAKVTQVQIYYVLNDSKILKINPIIYWIYRLFSNNGITTDIITPEVNGVNCDFNYLRQLDSGLSSECVPYSTRIQTINDCRLLD